MYLDYFHILIQLAERFSHRLERSRHVPYTSVRKITWKQVTRSIHSGHVLSFKSDPFTLHSPHSPLITIIRAQHDSVCDTPGLSKRQMLCLSQVDSFWEATRTTWLSESSPHLAPPQRFSLPSSRYILLQTTCYQWHFLSALFFFFRQNFLKDLLEKANKTVDDTKLAEYTDLMVRLN